MLLCVGAGHFKVNIIKGEIFDLKAKLCGSLYMITVFVGGSADKDGVVPGFRYKYDLWSVVW